MTDIFINPQYLRIVSNLTSMKWGHFFKTQVHIGTANSIPFLGIAVFELFTEDRIINAYDSFSKGEWFLPKWTFSILRSIALTFISFGSYRVWIADASKKSKHKAHLAYLLYGILLCLDWCTIFLSPTHLNIAALYYFALIFIAFNAAMVFKQIDKLSGPFYLPYIIWLVYMTIIHYILYIGNNNNEWFLNYDGSTNTTYSDKYLFSKALGSVSISNSSLQGDDILH